jgi:penicillin-binding protein 2
VARRHGWRGVAVPISFQNDKRMPQGRLAVTSYVIVGMIALLLFGFWKLQIIDSDRYAQLAERNRVRSIPIIAPRGSMLDREGRVLVDSYPSFSVLLLRDAPGQVERLLPQIADGLSMTLDEVKQEIDAAKAMPKFQPIVIKPEASPSDIAFIESHRADMPVLEMLMVHRRRYPHGDMLASAIGYVGEVSAEQVEASDSKLKPGDTVGKAGLERVYNDTLMGTDGLRRVIVNSIGKEVGRLEQQDAVPGKPIQLTIDYDLQSIADSYMADKEGAVVAMDGRTGEILAMVSRPTFDPKDFAVRVSAAEWRSLNSDPRTPLLNRAIQGQLAPGSVFKIVMATAMLESKALPENFTAICPGHADFYGRIFHCWRPAGHGVVDLHKAIVDSCDVFFYTIGQKLGIDRIHEYATGLGLGRRTGVDLPSEEAGLIPSEEWVQRVYHHKWYAGETISVAIGQGSVTVTPIQLVRMIAAVATGGDLLQPHLLKNFSAKADRFPLAEDTVEQVTQGMYGVINEGGTGASLKLQNIEFSGKSGTAQLMSYDAGSRLGKKGKETNGWFVGYAPRRNPEIVVAAVIQGSSEHGGTTAGPVVRDIVKAYYDKKSGHRDQLYTVKEKKPEVVPASVDDPSLANGQPDLEQDALPAGPANLKPRATR